MKEALSAIKVLNEIRRQPNPRRLALMEGPVNCNRNCDYCEVPKRWDKGKTSTLEQTFRQIDWLYGEGFRVLNYVGGEPLAESFPLGSVIPQPMRMCPIFDGRIAAEQPEEKIEQVAPFRTKEGITFEEHTEKVIEYANKKGMITNLTTNGDFVNYFNLRKLKKVGLDVLAFSLHSMNENSLKHIVGGARMAAKEGIIPIVSVVFTRDRAEEIPKIAEICAANGIFISTAVVQERGGGFSAVPRESKIPTLEQQKTVFSRLLELKKKGLVRTNLNYLNNAPNFPNNSWKCNPDTDAFVHIRAEGDGKVGVCLESPSRFQIDAINLKDKKWREAKRDFIEQCKGCLYACHYESENPNLKGDFPTLLNMLLIKSGHPELVKMLGRKALGDRISEIKPISQSENEKFQAKMNEYNKIYNKAKRGVFPIIDDANKIAILAVIYGYYGLIKHKNPNEILRRYVIMKDF